MITTKPGDIIGFSGRGWLSNAINLATYGIPHWGISHIGIIGESPDGRKLLFESTSLSHMPCAITGKEIVGTQAHHLSDIAAVYDGRMWRYPLYRELYLKERMRLNEFLQSTIGIKYDAMGAFRSAGLGFSFLESLFRSQNLHTIFCSEWVAAAFATTGLFPTANASRWNPNKLVRRLRLHGIIGKPERIK